MRKTQGAYLTVYMALCMTLMLSFCLTLIQGARRNGARLETEIVSEIALQSILAEYHRELAHKYNIFAIDSSYGTKLPGRRNIERHLQHYLEKNLTQKDIFLENFFYRDFFGLKPEKASVTKGILLTDGNGAVFRSCAADAAADDMGLEYLELLQEWMQVIEVNGLEEQEIETEKSRLDEEIQSYDGMEIDIGEEETYIFHVTNPTNTVEEQRRKGILKLVLEENQLSSKVLQTGNLIEERMKNGQINQGNMEIPDLSGQEALWERFLFQKYLAEYMGYFGNTKEQAALDYQIEYLIAAKEIDAENLRTIADRICGIREAANVGYLFSDTEKRGQAELLSEIVCDLAMVPELAPLLEGTILLGWAYAESVYDVKTLLAGGRIPLIKTQETWHYSLGKALLGDWQDISQEDMSRQEGLSYLDYLQLFMLCMDVQTLTQRAMNITEADIRLTQGNHDFRLDGCYTELEVSMEIGSSHGFDFQLTRKRSYKQ